MYNSGVYILHFEQDVPYTYAKMFGDSRHYVGTSTNIVQRIQSHLTGDGSEYTKVAHGLGINFQVAAIFPGEMFSMEQAITRLGGGSLCPICVTNGDRQLVKDRTKGLDKVSFVAAETKERRKPSDNELIDIVRSVRETFDGDKTVLAKTREECLNRGFMLPKETDIRNAMTKTPRRKASKSRKTNSKRGQPKFQPPRPKKSYSWMLGTTNRQLQSCKHCALPAEVGESVYVSKTGSWAHEKCYS